MEVSGELHSSATLPLWKEPQYPFDRDCVVPSHSILYLGSLGLHTGLSEVCLCTCNLPQEKFSYLKVD